MAHVTFYCPDRHISYDGHTPYRTGVGGGVTARVRMANALARAGHHVRVVANTPRRTSITGVEYAPLDSISSIQTDVLILNTSGDKLDLRPIRSLEVSAGLRLLWGSGVQPPAGLESIPIDLVYAKSNFLLGVVTRNWGVAPQHVFVSYNGFDEPTFRRAEIKKPERDPYRLIYFSHPSKGLDAAAAVLKKLRKVEPRFHLAVFGGDGLWGCADRRSYEEAGMFYHGLVGQERLAEELLKSSYALSLQAREEPFGMVVTESMRAGCVVLASAVGAYPELIRDGEDGFLIRGSHRSNAVVKQAARTILQLHQEPAERLRLQHRAQDLLWDSDTMAAAWAEHWNWWFQGKHTVGRRSGSSQGVCPNCQGEQLQLVDGLHCLRCGLYTPRQELTFVQQIYERQLAYLTYGRTRKCISSTGV
ncbi:MAG: glycosyltransferase family 4 protein [Anaerolineales bacterium]|nr:glycosyltransferase family 4 protein [Anaerolineales bacterium]